jgi:DNA ligase-1
VRDLADDYSTRYRWLTNWASCITNVVVHEQVEINNLEELTTYEELYLDRGYEGVILRDPNAPYKNGRSTVNEGYLLKMKRFVDAEFEVIGYEERMHNGNEATTNELGRTKRSSHKAGKVGLGDLGALVLRGDGFTFSVGTGFDDVTRKHLWEIRDVDLVGRLAKIKYFPIGMKEAPRHPVFLGWRDAIDLS